MLAIDLPQLAMLRNKGFVLITISFAVLNAFSCVYNTAVCFEKAPSLLHDSVKKTAL